MNKVLATLAMLLAQAGISPPTLEVVGRHVASYGTAGAEIGAYDPATRRLFVVNAGDATIDVLDIGDPSAPTMLFRIGMTRPGESPNSVAVHQGVVAVAVAAPIKTDPGTVAFFDTNGIFLSSVTVGALPDMLTFTHNGRYLLVANEGEPDDSYANDPEGSVGVISMAGGVKHVSQADVRIAGFGAFNGAVPEGVRVFGPGASAAQDFEPEFIAVSHDSKMAWVTLQENNALAILDVDAAQFTRVVPLGRKNYAGPGEGLDPSDRDGGIRIANWPVFGLFMPDAIDSFRQNGQTFLVLANEGDSRDYPAYSEEARVGSVALDPLAFPNAADLKKSAALGRLKITKSSGDTDGDGDFDELYAFGSRSFSIRDADGNLVWDSRNLLESITAETLPGGFNSDNTDNGTFDGRSDDKGPEPEAVVVGQAYGLNYVFVGLERVGGIAVFEISDPANPLFVQYYNYRDFSGSGPAGTAGDLGPEGVLFIKAEHSPLGVPLVVVTNEISGSTTIMKFSR